ncbi:MAG: DUF6077 domain-containing protein [Lachnospiraceae bacterium]|nr:DUF6077 domain-containing protein [Lachnospiraceae bacterium]
MLDYAYYLTMIVVYLCLYYMTGALVGKYVLSKQQDLPITVIVGFFCYFFLFTVVTLPLKLTLQPLSTLSLIWRVCMLLIVVLFFFTQREILREKIFSLRAIMGTKDKYVFLLFLLLLLIQLIIINLNDESYAMWDQSYYIGDASASLYTNTISQYDPYSGRLLSRLNTEYLLETYQNHTAVMCQIFGLHPLIENLTIMASAVVILYNLLVWELGKTLFCGNRVKCLYLTGFLTLLNFCSFNLYTAAEFLIIRPSEGKTILAVLIIPALLLFFMKTIKEYQSALWWVCSFLVILGSFGLNMSSIYIIPFEISAFYLPFFWREKKPVILVRWLILLLPCVLMAAAYLVTKYKVFIYTS